MPAEKLFLPLGHHRGNADRLRAIGWRTVAALSEADEPAALGCTHVLGQEGPVAL
jgi:ATP phosphoribosyltransferase regulatory subunit